MTESAADVASLTFEQARDELVRVVAELEQGTPTLEQSLALWERGESLAARGGEWLGGGQRSLALGARGESLAARCEEWLLGAKRRLDAARSAGAGASPTSAAEGTVG